MKDYLATGRAGFIGSAMVRRLVRETKPAEALLSARDRAQPKLADFPSALTEWS
jgi:nucleoside-diphosphate-sugar epimerase